nr:MAG TPA_asm: large terminase [Caudoviricetes sp.]
MARNDVFLPYQKAWLADKAPVKVVEKSRRVGLTWAQAHDDTLLAATSGRYGMDILYISFNQDMTREYIEACAEWAKRLQVVAGKVNEDVFRDGDEREIKAFRIDFASGHKILALSNRPSNLRGKQGRVVIDEAAFVEDLPELLKAALALLMWGGQVIIISTHNGVDNAFNQLVQDVRGGNLPYSLHRITLDDALKDGLYRRICQVTEKPWTVEAEAAWRADLIKTYGDGADEELFCIPRQSSGAYLTTAMIEACMEPAPVLTWTPPAENFVDWPLPVAETYTKGWIEENLAFRLEELPKDRAHFCGVDFGRSGDLSVFWPATEEKDLRLVPPFVLELRNCPHRTQQQILFAILDRLPRFSGVSLDARGNGSALAEAARQEYGPAQVREVMISESWYRETMPILKAGIEDKTLILPKDAGILSDFRSLRVVKGVARVPEQRTKDKTGGRHGDSAVACAMMLDARKELGSAEPWDYVGIPMNGFDLNGW